METTGHSNSTDLVHGHGHHHLPDLDGTKASDEVIILILGAIVFLTFALGLAFQLCDKPVWFLRRKQLAWQEGEEYEDIEDFGDDCGQIHQMAEFDVEAAAATAAQTLSGITEPLLKPGSSHQLQLHPFRGATRYGTITQHHVEVGGVRKMVLVVEADLGGEGPSTGQDGYTEWFEGWRERNGIKGGVEITERALEEGDLTDEGTSFATAAVNETSATDESPPLLDFDLDEDQDEDQDERSDSYHTACM
ncbi:hypothetical protein BJX66DRAFT_332254 [Aspergillus keveii]|uniref:RING finger domain protein n=1 Tax=Aspergillus keveii TaxID=714993 RepID=A0ABR4GM10_9EURO